MELPIVEAVTPGRSDKLGQTGPFYHIELEILTACDHDCFGCDRFSDVTNAPNMTLAQVRLFVQESLELNWNWQRIRILGGEPTLHPQIREIVEAILDYRDLHPKCFVQLLSNGHGKLDQHRAWLTRHGVDPHVEAKEHNVTPAWFNNTRIAPVDRDQNVGALPPCGIFGGQGCGIGLTRHGYFLDGAGASAARIAGFDVGVMRLRDVTLDAMLAQARVLCRICGHWNAHDKIVTKLVKETGKITGPFWTQKLAEFKQNPPKLRIYGTV